MKNVVHVDEKWFYVTRGKRKISQFPQEQRHSGQMVVHKSHIQKVMFLAAVGIPQEKPDGSWFDGKIGIWRVQEPTTALRSSVLRSAGTEVTKSVS
jgi:hypothetical protein